MLSESSKLRKHLTIQSAGKNFYEESSTEGAVIDKADIKAAQDEV